VDRKKKVCAGVPPLALKEGGRVEGKKSPYDAAAGKKKKRKRLLGAASATTFN